MKKVISQLKKVRKRLGYYATLDKKTRKLSLQKINGLKFLPKIYSYQFEFFYVNTEPQGEIYHSVMKDDIISELLYGNLNVSVKKKY